jgi:hypothetical protein
MRFPLFSGYVIRNLVPGVFSYRQYVLFRGELSEYKGIEPTKGRIIYIYKPTIFIESRSDPSVSDHPHLEGPL